MMENRQKQAEFNFATIVDFLYLHRVKLIIITLAAGILGFVFSLPVFIHPKYRSIMVFYPSTNNSISKSVLVSGNSAAQDVTVVGREDEAEQLLQFLHSDEITGKICQKFHLMRHYRIDPNSKYPNTKLGDRFSDNVKYRRTEYMSVEVDVLDEDRDTAAMIANDIGALLDSVKGKILQQRAKEALSIVKRQYDDKQDYVNILVDSLKKLGKKGVLTYTDQAAALSQSIADAHSEAQIKQFKAQLDTLAKYGPVQSSLADQLRYEIEDLNMLKTKYELIKVDAEKILPAKFIINAATPSEKKAYPDRILIIALSMAAAFAMSVIILALITNYKTSKKSLQEASITKEELVNA